MARDPLAAVGLTATAQIQRILGRTDQLRNNAGGYVFAKDLFTKVEDFLVLGTTGGTYYITEDRLTVDNAGWLIQAIQADGTRVVQLITEVSTARPPRAPKNRAAVFALAMVFSCGDPAAVQAAKAAFARVVRTTDHLSMFFGYAKQVHGKAAGQGTSLVSGRALRSALASWFLAGEVDAIAWKACKARQRVTPAGETFALRDALRIAHPKADTAERRALLGWLAGKVADGEARSQVQAVDAFLSAQAVTTEAAAIAIATERKVPWEFLPSALLASPTVWEALIPHLGVTALLRNLARLTRLGVLGPFAPANEAVAARLRSAEALRNGRIHPMDVFLALRVYLSGQSQPDRRAERHTWTPVAEISDALEEAYEQSSGHVQPSGKRMLVAVDSSGSMSGAWGRNQLTLGGSPLGTPYEIGCAMAAILKRIEGGNVHVIDVDTQVHPSRITTSTRVREIGSWRPSGGGTDLSLPFTHATQRKLKVDGFALFTDGETWAGRQHASQALAAYRRKYNPGARVVLASMVAVGHSIAEPEDAGVLNIAGMDAALPMVATEFIR
jgi:60 kDa SS-A/Ro ribonucleoprotein